MRTLSSWTEAYSPDESLEIIRELAWSHALRAGPYRHEICSFLVAGDYRGLCSYNLDYTRGDSALSVYHTRQALSFFQKSEWVDLGVDREAVAFSRFLADESSCRDTNNRFRAIKSGKDLFPSRVHSVLHGMQRKISQILGPVPSVAELDFSFGPGANTSVKATKSSARWKLGADMACSADMEPYVSEVLRSCPSWAELHAVETHPEGWVVEYEVHPGKLQFVPKNWKTYRSIVVEPILNSFVQKGIGTWIRRRLQYAGVDLSSQERNQMLAKSGSAFGSLATIDLSSASDTISYEMVWDLLPYDWADFLSRFRTGTVVYKGCSYQLAKFSSMGNAYTFELESLLFYSLAWSVCKFLNLPVGWTSVYGDDIIVPVEAFSLLEESLRCLGFSLNSEKSFRDGPFRESCGKDFWNGQDIRPYYQKSLVTGASLFVLHNFYVRRGFSSFARKVLQYLHPSLAIFGPDGYGDGHLLGDHPRRVLKKHAERGWSGYVFDTFTLRKKRNLRPSKGDRILPAYSIYVSRSGECSDHFVVRGDSGYRRVSIYTLG